MLILPTLRRTFERRKQSVHLFLCVVKVEARPSRRSDAEAAHQWLGAVVAAPYGYALLVQELGEVVRMHVRH